ncbi:hypothetical protein BBI17_009050 [Phytophthora kernoviae]|uniref:Uncharacterized protein n=1 Tax=Phytophthora kernoviae TaxID=325452 RepID=A0A421F3V8_9STRA|nr:hypothetical protein BBI17_009050 [Phytophthora kernoviae]
MFLCAREASTGPSGAPPPPLRLLGRSPEASENGEPSAYLQVLDALTRLIAQLLDVHTLSPALRFSAGQQVAVDAAEWWKEVQRQSIALVQRLEAAPAADNVAEGKQTTAEMTVSSLWSLASRQQQQKPQEQQRKTGEQANVTQCEAFAELSENSTSVFYEEGAGAEAGWS